MQLLSRRGPFALCAALALVAFLLLTGGNTRQVTVQAGPFVQQEVRTELASKPTTNVLITLHEQGDVATLSRRSLAWQQAIAAQKVGVLAGV